MKKQTALSRIWTWVNNSIFYDSNSYTKGNTFLRCYLIDKLPD